MIGTATTLWPHQELALAEIPRRIDAGERRILLTSPTGGGKSRVACGLIEWALARSWQAILYTNRRLLIDQLAGVLSRHGIRFGVRAAGHDDERHRAVQISSLPTERSRTLNAKRWEVHGGLSGGKLLAIVDEAHINSSDTARQILGMHHQAGAVTVGLTATPIGLGHLYGSLVVAGVPSELRRCGALVPAYHYGPDEPDMKDFKASVKTGEFTEGDVKKAVMTKCIFARVLEHYQEYNPDQRPTILFAPGVPESIWFAEQLSQPASRPEEFRHLPAVRAAHIDGEGVWLDGQFTRGGNREQVLDAVRTGDIKVLCNRFVLREGLDLPEVSHLVLATVMGSLQSYLQSVGRGLRAAPGKDRLTIQDHGGHWHRHGSANADRHWELTGTENVLNGLRADRFREKKDHEPIHCPKCHLIRAAGAKCPACGHESCRKTRVVVQVDGTLREHDGDIYKPRVTRMKPDTARLWQSMYHRARRSKTGMTFRQARGLFFHEHHYWPPSTIPLMPATELDWFLPVKNVPVERLT